MMLKRRLLIEKVAIAKDRWAVYHPQQTKFSQTDPCHR